MSISGTFEDMENFHYMVSSAKKRKKMPSMTAHISKPRAQEAEAGGLHQVGDQPELDYTENSRPSRGTL